MIGIIANKYATSDYADVIVGIQLLNEPLLSELAGGKAAAQAYYQSGFDIVRQSGQTMVIIHDGFDNPSEWNGFLTGWGNTGAIVDHHEYQVFTTEQVALSPEEHVSTVYSRASSWAQGQDKFVICGEWTAAMTDCAPALVSRPPEKMLSCSPLIKDRTAMVWVRVMMGHMKPPLLLGPVPTSTPSSSGVITTSTRQPTTSRLRSTFSSP